MRIFLTTFVIAAFFASAKSQVIFTENFDYPAGDSIGAHQWTSFSGSVNPLMVVSPGLTYTGYPGSGVGNACRVSNNGIDAYKNFSDSATSGFVYVSCLVKIDTAKTGDYFLALLPQSSTTLYTPRLFVKDSSGTLSFGISKGATTSVPATYSANGYAYGTTYLLVLKYKFNSGTTTDDEVSLFVFASPTLPTTEPTTPTIGPITASTPDANSIGRIALRQGSASLAPSLTIDAIRGARTWNGIVTGIRQVETVATSFSLSQNYPNPFNPVTNIRFAIPANGFVTLKVYDILGNEVSTLVNAQMQTGVYTYNLDGAKLSSGTYMYKLSFNGANGMVYNDIKKMMLIK
ncbi:MAG: T9SS type A sorting domain-containing protein [Bacteroidetes bacterium]|nr:T9SS type A sorting domain-containing protein [Bacteroidota bacterium]